MKKIYSVEVLLKKNDMSRFLIRHNYSRFGGVFGVILSLAALVGLVVMWEKLVWQQTGALIVLALMFTVIQPYMLWSKGRKQLKQEYFTKPFHYEFTAENISVSQEEYREEYSWAQVKKVVSAKDAIYIYMTKLSAYIIPKHACEGEYVELVKFIKEKSAVGK